MAKVNEAVLPTGKVAPSMYSPSAEVAKGSAKGSLSDRDGGAINHRDNLVHVVVKAHAWACPMVPMASAESGPAGDGHEARRHTTSPQRDLR